MYIIFFSHKEKVTPSNSRTWKKAKIFNYEFQKSIFILIPLKSLVMSLVRDFNLNISFFIIVDKMFNNKIRGECNGRYTSKKTVPDCYCK